MQKRKLGGTDLELTTIGLGTWAMGGGDWSHGWGPQDDTESIAAIHRAIELGINWIDTAPVYGFGRAELVVGEAVKAMPQRPILATKCGLDGDDDQGPYFKLEPDHIRRQAETSLRRLGVDVIDLMQIHWPRPEEDIEKGWEAVAKLVDDGLVRYAGVSNFSVEQLERIRPIHPVASNQPPYSMFRREVERDVLIYCAQHEIGTVAYSPMQKGMLTDKFTRQWVESLPESDHRERDPMFCEPQLTPNLEAAERLSEIAAANGKTLAELAIAWVLRRPEVTAAIVGARRPDQIERTAPAGDWAPGDDDVAKINAILTEREAAVA